MVLGAGFSSPMLKGWLTSQLLGLLERQGTEIKAETAQGIVKTVLEFSPRYFPMTGKGIRLMSIAAHERPSHIIYIKGGPVGPGPSLVP